MEVLGPVVVTDQQGPSRPQDPAARTRRPDPWYWYATWFGTGLVPRAPATVASLTAIPVHLLLQQLPVLLHALVVVAVTLAGIVAAQRTADKLGDDDPQVVVIDEVAGMLLALLLAAPQNWWGIALVFGLFRLFDITKPWLIGRAEALQPAGMGIMADDLAAGAAAGLAAAFGLWLIDWAL